MSSTKPVFALPLAAGNVATKVGLEGAINVVIDQLWPLSTEGSIEIHDAVLQAKDDAEAAAQAAADARDAIPDVQADTYDSTPGRVALSGSFGLGVEYDGNPKVLENLDDHTIPDGQYMLTATSTGTLPAGISMAGMLVRKRVLRASDHLQELVLTNGTTFIRGWNSTTGFGSWIKRVTSADMQAEADWQGAVSIVVQPTTPERVKALLDAQRPVFASRAAAIAATVPAPVQVITVKQGGIVLTFSRSAAAAALATNGGTIHWAPSGIVHPEHFGAVGDGTANDQPAFNSACLYVYSVLGGGEIHGVPGSNYLLDTSLHLQRGVHLIGPQREGFGSPQSYSDNYIFDITSVKGWLILNPAATITTRPTSSIIGFGVRPKGMIFPQINADAWMGTAITLGGWDCAVKNNFIVGFDKAVASNGNARLTITGNKMDNVNGLDIVNSVDANWVDQNECWPFLTIKAWHNEEVGASHIRSGTAFRCENVDWSMLTDNFSFGYYRGTLVVGNEVQIKGGGADNRGGGVVHPNSCGLLFTGTRSSIHGFFSAANNTNIQINVAGGKVVTLDGCVSWGAYNRSVLMEGAGQVSVRGIIHENCPNGFAINSADLVVINGGGHIFKGVTTEWLAMVPINTVNVPIGGFISNKADGGSPVSGTIAPLSVASAANIMLPHRGGDHITLKVTGTTNIGTLQGWWPGRKVTLIFDSTAGALHSLTGPNNMRLAGSTNFTGAAGRSLHLIHTGEYWEEWGRKIP